MITPCLDEAAAFSFQLDEFYLDLQKDGSRISLLSKEKIVESPFPGLRPFKTSEFQLFKGRGGQAEELIKRLKKNHFLAVIGSSGTGKSSLVRAGLIPQLLGGYLHEAGNKWNIAICRPGKNPIENLSIALANVKGLAKNNLSIHNHFTEVDALLNQSVYGILEMDERMDSEIAKEEKPNLLIIIDQFEELFRFNRKDLCKDNIESHFVNLLLKASLNASSSVYVIITMRSEFLGDCVRFRGLPEAINEGQYLVPQLTRNQLKEVIECPVTLAGKQISPGLVELLINEIEESKLKENLDQLPILQHALMRTYQQAMKDGPDTEISFEHYKAVGEMHKALANHAEAKFRELADGPHKDNKYSGKQKIAKIVFQALTDLSTDQKGGRRPTELSTINAIATMLKVHPNEVDEVINHFRDDKTSFIMPPANVPLYPILMLDISHESLMRNWERLSQWIAEEVRYGKLYQMLNERREFNENGDKNEWIRGVLLNEMTDWRNHTLTNEAWASRYHSNKNRAREQFTDKTLFDKNIAFLDKSAAESELEKIRVERRKRFIVLIFGVATLISIVFMLFAFVEWNKAKTQKNIAERQKTEAVKQEKFAVKYAREAERQEEMAKANAQDADLQKNKALDYAQEAEEQRNLALQFAQKAQEQAEATLKAGFEKQLAEHQNEILNMQLVKNDLQNETFYKSNAITASLKDSIMGALFIHPLINTKKILPDPYIHVVLLHDVNEAVTDREKVITDPVKGLRLADALWKRDTNRIIKTLFLDIFHKNIFYRQEIKPGSYNPSLLTVSADSAHFAMNNLNAITTGEYTADGIKINHRFTSQLFDDSTNNRYSKSVIIALKYIGNTKVFSLGDNGKIMEWEPGKVKKVLSEVPEVSNATIAEFSADGMYVVTVSKENALMRLWKIADLTAGKKLPLIADSNAINRRIKQIVISPDSKRMIMLFTDGKLDGWDIGIGKRLPQLQTFRYFTAVNFTPDSRYVLTASSDKAIAIFDGQGREVNSFYLPSSIERNVDYAYFSYARISNLSLDSTWKKMIVEHEGGKTFVAQAATDSIITIPANIKYRKAGNFSLKRLNTSTGIKKAVFIKNNIISINEDGIIHSWEPEADFNTLDQAFLSVRKLMTLSYTEKIEAGQISFEQVKADSNKNNLRVAAGYYYGKMYEQDEHLQKQSAIRAKELYRRLANTDTGYAKTLDLGRIIASNNELNAMEEASAGGKPDYHKIVERLEENVAIGEEQLKTNPEDADLKYQVSNAYWSLSWRQLFIGHFPQAVVSAKRGLFLFPANDGIITNMALGYLLNNQYDSAKALYTKYADRKFQKDTRLFRTEFLNDFTLLEAAKVILPGNKDVARIREEVLKKK